MRKLPRANLLKYSVIIFWLLAGCAPVAEAQPSATTAVQPTLGAAVSTATALPAGLATQGSSSTAGQLSQVGGEYIFAEGPAVDSTGSVYFADLTAGKIYKWSPDGQVTVFKDGLDGPNGMDFDQKGSLIACEGGRGRVISIDMQGKHGPG